MFFAKQDLRWEVGGKERRWQRRELAKEKLTRKKKPKNLIILIIPMIAIITQSTEGAKQKKTKLNI
jgi:hypothetical protein